jgi:integrase
MAFYADTAVRRTLGAQLQLKHIDFTGDRPTFEPNPDGENQKGVALKNYPLYDCVAEVRVWINQYHPENERDGERNPEEPLWADPRSYDYDNVEDSGLTAGHIGSLVRKYGDLAGLDEDKIEIKTHAFRHAAIGRWKAAGYSLAFVQRRTAWKDKAAAAMWGQYGNPDDADVDAEIDRLEGREVPDRAEDDTNRKETYDCGNCPSQNHIPGDYCPSCGGPVSPAAIEEESGKDPFVEQLEKMQAKIERLEEETT